MQNYSVKEALKILKPGMLIKSSFPSNGARQKIYNDGWNDILEASFPKEGLVIRDIRISYKYKSEYQKVGHMKVPFAYELLFHGMPNNYYLTHSNVDFAKSDLHTSPLKNIDIQIEDIESTILEHANQVNSFREKIEKAQDKITQLKSRKRLMAELGEEVDEKTLNAYVLVKELKGSKQMSELEMAKALVKFLKKNYE
jgi:flagellar biosynthesis chaperone FliJ